MSKNTSKSEKGYNCDICKDTGYYGNYGPGVIGNSEYQICDNCEMLSNEPEKAQAGEGRVNTIVSVPFTEMQLSIIAKAVEAFLVDDTVIVDDDGNLHDELTITLKNDAQGIRYYLGLEDTKPDYFNEV